MFCFLFSSRRRHTRCALVTGVQTCALPICEIDAVLNYWHYSARLEAKGFRRIVGANDAAMALGAAGPISAIGYVFDEDWAARNLAAARGFLAPSRAAKALLRRSDAEWGVLREDRQRTRLNYSH